MVRLTCITFLILITAISCKESKSIKNNDKEKIISVCEDIMQLFKEAKYSNALYTLKQNSVMGNSIDTLEMTILEQMKKASINYGKTLSYEFINERNIKNFITKRFYILKFEKYYLKFDFTLYNNGRNWTITGFNFNEDLIEILY